MLESISHTKFLEWVAYHQILEEEAEKAREEAKSGDNSPGRRTVSL